MISTLKGNILLENGSIYDPCNNKKIKGAILLQNGIIKEVGDCTLPKNVKRVNCQGMIIAPGLIDIHAHFREPGREDKETLVTGMHAAFAGGILEFVLCLIPIHP